MLVARLEVNTVGASWIMRKNPLTQRYPDGNAAGVGTVTSETVEARARELAAINGRPSPNRPRLTINRPNVADRRR